MALRVDVEDQSLPANADLGHAVRVAMTEGDFEWPALQDEVELSLEAELSGVSD